jgi:hypothetical protein
MKKRLVSIRFWITLYNKLFLNLQCYGFYFSNINRLYNFWKIDKRTI